MSHPNDVDPARAQRVKLVEALRDAIGVQATLVGSKSLAQLLGVAVPDEAGCVLVSNVDAVDTIYYNPAGTATSANFPIPAGTSLPIYGDKAFLDTVRLYSGGAESPPESNVGLLVRNAVVTTG